MVAARLEAALRNNLTQAKHNSRLRQVIGRHFHFDPVTDGQPDEPLPHLARNMRQHLVLIFQFDTKHGPGQYRQNPPFCLNVIFHF